MNSNNLSAAILVSVTARYLEEQSDSERSRYAFAYTITIRNDSDQTIQLLSRRWLITDSNFKEQEVRGEGVVGEQPVIKPGQSFEYSSGATLETAVGTMCGSYTMRALDGSRFEVPIKQFVLSIPRTLH